MKNNYQEQIQQLVDSVRWKLGDGVVDVYQDQNGGLYRARYWVQPKLGFMEFGSGETPQDAIRNLRLKLAAMDKPPVNPVLTAQMAEDLMLYRQQVHAHDESFKIRWEADMKAIRQWRAADPANRDLRWPSHVDLCVWLMDKLKASEENAITDDEAERVLKILDEQEETIRVLNNTIAELRAGHKEEISIYKEETQRLRLALDEAQSKIRAAGL